MTHEPTVRGDASAADVLGPRWRQQVARLRFWDTEVRAQRPGSVHHFRVAARRLRSEVAGFEELLDAGAARVLRDDLRSAAVAVGDARDHEVVRGRLEPLFDEVEPAASAALREGLRRLLGDSEAASWDSSLAYLDGPEYDGVTRRLETFVDLTPWSAPGGLPAAEVLRPLLRAEWSRFRKLAVEALDPAAGPDADERLHEARKAAKRARYVAEAVVPVFGRRAERLARAAERAQRVLGEHQDHVLTEAFLAGAAGRLDLDGAESRQLAALVEREAAAGARREDVERVLVKARRTSLRAWLR